MNAMRHNELKSFWELQAEPIARHHISGLDEWANFVDDRIFCHLQGTGYQRALEWGCGSGDIALKLAERGYDIHLADILDTSLDRSELNLLMRGYDVQTKTCLREIQNPGLPFESIDLLVSVAVIQHFPSYAYWRQVASLWRGLNPSTIILQTRHSDVLKEPKDYSEDYLFSLWLPTEAVLSEFPGYEVVFHQLDTPDSYMWAGHADYEFFVLRRPSTLS